MEILSKVTPLLDGLRGILMKVAEFGSGAFDVSQNNVYLVLLAIFSLWLPTLIYSRIKEKLNTWLVVSFIIFAVVKWI